MPLAKDLLHPSPEEEKRRHKKKRLVQSPNSYFMDVKCPGTGLKHPKTPDLNSYVSTCGISGNVGFTFLTGFFFLVLSLLQDATRSQRCSATLRQLCCVWAVQPSCVSPLEAKPVSQRGAHSGGSSISYAPWS
uniref:40S ribosomal protein S27 n=1 Tax=Anabas testudineus TaxID=64144 RepID=A0A3Q1I6R9_ANATE